MNSEQAFSDWYDRNLTDKHRSLAGQWYDGRSSAMYRLFATSFMTDLPPFHSIKDLNALKKEVGVCIGELVGDNEDREGLVELENFAKNAIALLRLFSQMKQSAEGLISLGVYEEEVNSVVKNISYAASHDTQADLEARFKGKS